MEPRATAVWPYCVENMAADALFHILPTMSGVCGSAFSGTDKEFIPVDILIKCSVLYFRDVGKHCFKSFIHLKLDIFLKTCILTQTYKELSHCGFQDSLPCDLHNNKTQKNRSVASFSLITLSYWALKLGASPWTRVIRIGDESIKGLNVLEMKPERPRWDVLETSRGGTAKISLKWFLG